MKKYKNLIELRFKIKREYSGVRKVSTNPPPFIYWMVNKFESNSKFKKIKYWKFMKSMKNLSALNYHKRWNLLPFVGKLGTKKLFTKQSKQPTERKNEGYGMFCNCNAAEMRGIKLLHQNVHVRTTKYTHGVLETGTQQLEYPLSEYRGTFQS